MTPFAQKLEDIFSYADYRLWDTGRWEILDGQVYDMTPAPSRQHQKISGDLFAIIHEQLTGNDCEVYAAPFDVRLPDSVESADSEIITVVQPDIVVVCDLEKLDDRGCIGSPDLVVEILSPATAAKDLKIKRDLYERHGVREYWIVHPVDKIFMVYRLGAEGDYPKALIFSGADMIDSMALKGVQVKLEDIFGIFKEKEVLPAL